MDVWGQILIDDPSLCLTAPFSPVSSLTPSSGTSEDLDQQEIQLAVQVAKAAARNKIRSRFHSSSDLIHRLFVCISGIKALILDSLSTHLFFSLGLISILCFCVMQVLLISFRPTMRVTFAASSRLFLKSWQPSVRKETMISRRKVRKVFFDYEIFLVLQYFAFSL